MRLVISGSVSALAFAVSLASPAVAQDVEQDAAAEDSGQQYNTDIVVTAQFREARLQDTPIAITAMNAEMLEARGHSDVSQIAAQSPNVTLSPTGQEFGSGLVAFIRGVGQSDFNFALEPGVGIYVDDVYYSTVTGSLLDLMDLDRVEVLRGPQGTLAGKNSIGGAIKLYSRKPTGSNTGSLQATYGSYNRMELRGSADIALADNLFARVAGVGKTQDGYITRLDYGLTHPGSGVASNNAQGRGVELGTLGGKSYTAGKLALRWLPTDRLEINIAGDYTNDKSEAGPSVLRYANSAANTGGAPWMTSTIDGSIIPLDCRFVPHGAFSCDTTPAGYDSKYITYGSFLDSKPATDQMPYKPLALNPIQHFKGWGVQGNVLYDLTDTMELTWISSYRHYTTTWAQDVDNSPLSSQLLNQSLELDAWSQELRLNGELADGLIDYTVGGFYFEQDGVTIARIDLNYAGLDFQHGPDDTPSHSKAAFLNATIHPAPDWNISGGLRYSKDKKSYTYRRSNPDGTYPSGPCTAPPTTPNQEPNCALFGLDGLTDVFEGNRWDWRIVTDYRFSDAFLAYGSIATGYKGGGVNPRPYFASQIQPFEPETMTTYELGFKSDLFDRRLRLNGAAFFNKYDDIILQLTACPGSPCLQPNNIGKADVKGLELEAIAYPLDGLSFDGSVSYLDFDYKEVTDATSNVTLDMITPYTPEWSWSFGVQYDHEIQVGLLSARFDGSYRSHVYSEAVNNDTHNRIDGYFMGNARLSYTTLDEDWQVSLEVRNLFDKYYFMTLYDQHQPNFSATVSGSPGMPRTWALTVKRNF